MLANFTEQKTSRGSSRGVIAAISKSGARSEGNTIVDESLFDFLGEHPLRANLREGNVGYFIAGGLDDLQFHGMALSAEQIGDVVGLPERELRGAGTDTQAGHQSSGPFSAPRPRADFEAAAPFSSSSLCRLS